MPLQWIHPSSQSAVPPIPWSWLISCSRDNIQALAVLVAYAVGAGMHGGTAPSFPESWDHKREAAAISPLLSGVGGLQFIAGAAAMALIVQSHDTGAVLHHILREIPATPLEEEDYVMPSRSQWVDIVSGILQEAQPELVNDTCEGNSDQRFSKPLSKLATVFENGVAVKTKLHGTVNFTLPLGSASGLVMRGTGDLQEYVVVVARENES